MNDRSGLAIIHKKKSVDIRRQHIALARLAGAALLLMATSVGRAASRLTPEWLAQFKTGVVCTDSQLHPMEHNIKCSDEIEKAMRLTVAQLPPLPKGVSIEVEIWGIDPDDIYDYSILVSVSDHTGVESTMSDIQYRCTVR